MASLDAERELRLYRGLCLLVGVVYLLWWVAVEALLPDAYNPLLGRLVVVVAMLGVVAGTYTSAWTRRHVQTLWIGGLWLLTAHYFYLFYKNDGGIDWVVGAFITVTAISLGLLSRASLLAYSAFTTALSIALVIAVPALRQSVFLPGLATVLLQANLGLASRLRVLRDLAERNAHVQLLFDSTFEGVLIHDGARITQVNEALARILGTPRDGLVGREVARVFDVDDRGALQRVLTGEAGPVEVHCRRGDGGELDLEVRGKPFVDGVRTLRLVTVTDISERKRRAAELRAANEALTRSNRELQRFAYIASHDLQTPLRSIASFIDLLRETYGDRLDAQALDWLSRAGGSVEHLRSLIDDLLAYSRVDAEPRAFEAVAMRNVLERVRTLLDAPIREADATLTADELPEVHGDRSQLVQLVANLVGNAVKYRSSAPPKIHITARTRDDDWLFEVRDNGIGIAPRHHDYVFEVFKRLHSQKEFPGTGVGLAICRRVVERHGGRIWVDSTGEDGCTFSFTIARKAGST